MFFLKCHSIPSCIESFRGSLDMKCVLGKSAFFYFQFPNKKEVQASISLDFHNLLHRFWKREAFPKLWCTLQLVKSKEAFKRLMCTFTLHKSHQNTCNSQKFKKLIKSIKSRSTLSDDWLWIFWQSQKCEENKNNRTQHLVRILSYESLDERPKS